MKIKQIGSYSGDIVSTVLRNREIPDINRFLNPNNENLLDPFKLTNVRFAAGILLSHIEVDSHIGLLIDPDADGFTSSSIIYQYIKRIKPDIKITLFFHDLKTHGLTEAIMDKISNTDIELLIIPDAASNNNKEIKKLHYMEIDLIIIDHHEIEKYPEFGILINNQASNKATNTNLVGAGMVLKFCEALDALLNVNYAEDYYDLAALGQVGDDSDISENEARYIVFRGLDSLNNPFIKIALKDFFEDLDKVAPRDLSFSIIPLINAVVRVGVMEEKELLFRALNEVNSNETFKVIKRKKDKETGKFNNVSITQNIWEYTLDVCKKVKDRQNKMIKKTMIEINETLDASGGIAIGIINENNDGTVTGLAAKKIAGKLQKPVILIKHKNGKYTGSGRGYEKVLPSLKDWCNATGLVEFAQGHANAFGISISEENFEAFKTKTKEVTPIDFVYEVDLWLKGKVDKQSIYDIDANKYLFGGKVHQPLFAFTGIKIEKSNIKMKNSTLSFMVDGVEFIMFDVDESIYDDLTCNFDRYLTIDFVGTPNINKFLGKITPQIIISDFEKNNLKEEPEEVTWENICF
jgi:single-stranded-DNA-specific exonuclease